MKPWKILLLALVLAPGLCPDLVWPFILSDQITNAQQVWMARRGIEDTFEIESLRPRSELVWAACDCIVSTLCTQMCPGPNWRTTYSTDVLCRGEEAGETTKTGRMDHNSVWSWFVLFCVCTQGAAVGRWEWRDEVKCVQTQVSDWETGPGEFDLLKGWLQFWSSDVLQFRT